MRLSMFMMLVANIYIANALSIYDSLVMGMIWFTLGVILISLRDKHES